MSTQARQLTISEVCVNAWLRFIAMGKKATFLNIKRLVTPVMDVFCSVLSILFVVERYRRAKPTYK